MCHGRMLMPTAATGGLDCRLKPNGRKPLGGLMASCGPGVTRTSRARRIQATQIRLNSPPLSPAFLWIKARMRSEEHTSELQSLAYLVCRLLLEKKKKVLDSDILERTIRH